MVFITSQRMVLPVIYHSRKWKRSKFSYVRYMSKHEIFFKVVDSNVVSFLLQHELLAQIAPEGIGAFHLDNWLCPPAPCLSCSFSRPCNTVCYKKDNDAQIEKKWVHHSEEGFQIHTLGKYFEIMEKFDIPLLFFIPRNENRTARGIVQAS